MAPPTIESTATLLSVIPTRQDIINLENDAHKCEGSLDGHPQRLEKAYRTQISTTAASLAALMASYPLQTCQSNMQVEDFNGFFNCARRIFREGGVKGFYRGVTSPIGSQTLWRLTSMSTYQHAKYNFSDYLHRHYGTDPLVSANTPGVYPDLATVVCFSGAGLMAGFVASFVSAPFELIAKAGQLSKQMARHEASATQEVPSPQTSSNAKLSTRVGSAVAFAQTKTLPEVKLDPKVASEKLPSVLNTTGPGSDYLNKGSYEISRTIRRNRGGFEEIFRFKTWGLFTGFRLHLLRDTIGSGLYFASYETTKQAYNAYRGSSTPSSPPAVVFASTICGIVSLVLIYPIDTAKTKYQRNSLMLPKGQYPPWPEINYFDRCIYRGLGVSMFRSVVTATAFFSVFEAIKKHINGLPDRRYDQDLD